LECFQKLAIQIERAVLIVVVIVDITGLRAYAVEVEKFNGIELTIRKFHKRK
jgi:hypothetical protein